MAKSKAYKRMFNLAYGLGASVVIIGALFKINYWPYGDYVIALGLIVEAIIFAIAAFEPIDEEYDWSLVYPELNGGEAKALEIKSETEAGSMLSSKLDKMLEEAKLDASMMVRLKDGIEGLGNSVSDISKTVNASSLSQKYGEQLSIASSNMESLNAMYKVQLERGKLLTESVVKTSENSKKLEGEFDKLSTNLSSLNSVYGGMLSAMGNNK